MVFYFGKPVELTEDDTGAEIEAILLRAIQFGEEEGQDRVETQDVVDACDDFIRSRNQAQFDLMTALAIRFTNSKRMLPPEYRQMAETGESERRIEELAPRASGKRTGGREL